jgi:surface polysaccharide O-acyltransferase-like enzyme
MATAPSSANLAEAPLKTASEGRSRLVFVDHLRTALIVLVVLHHVSLVYGASVTPFYYFEPPFTDPLAFLILLVFALFNQAWFMGAFFLLAGYFTPGSFDRKGPGGFIKDRLVRLGIPILLFTFVLSPISWIGLFEMPAEITGITTPLSWQAYPALIGLGPLWFVALLLIFSFGYVGWRLLRKTAPPAPRDETSRPGYMSILVFVLALAAGSYLIRIVIPLGKSVSLGFYFLSFPTLAYLPQYLSFFVLGAIAARHDCLKQIPLSMGIVGFVVALAAAILLFPLAISGHWFSLQLSDAIAKAFGYGQWQSAVYALWDSVFAVGMCLGLIPFFRRYFNGGGRLGKILSQQSYAVYVFHIPVVVFLALAIRGIELPTLAKAGVASLIIVPSSFLVAYVIRKIPGASRVF